MVDVMTPPMTARPRGARHSAPSPLPMATGSMLATSQEPLPSAKVRLAQ